MNLMLCKTATIETIPKNWIYESKEDGDRIWYSKGRLFNRRGIDVTNRYPEVEIPKELWNYEFDGEMIVKNKSFYDGIAKRTHLQNTFAIERISKSMPVTYMIFDIIDYTIPLIQRKEILSKLDKIREVGSNIEIIKYHNDYNELWNNVINNNKEGIIAKDPNSYYKNKRSYSWLKVKLWHEISLMFNHYEINPKGITLENDDGIRVAVLGYQSNEVINLIKLNGYVRVVCQYLEKTDNQRYRFISFKEVDKNGL